MLLSTMLVPTAFALLFFAWRNMPRKLRNVVFVSGTCLTSLFVLLCLLNPDTQTFVFMPWAKFADGKLHLDGLGRVFAGLVAVLWPFASLYTTGYMEHEGKEGPFYGFYLLSYAVTLGIAFAGDLMTLFIFYELLALSTLFLVMHGLDAKRVHAGRKYMAYSLGGASLAFMAMQFVRYYANGQSTFAYGGIPALNTAPFALMLVMFVMAFFGFGVKAAVFPLHGWLPSAGVAPTPVTALLHAVAVVKAGAFAVIRTSYYTFNPDMVRGTWAHTLCLIITVIGIIYGSAMAVREQHLKRRLAFSTMSNLSYVLFGCMLLTQQGLTGSLLHMVFHAFMKITLFACVGAMMIQAGRSYVEDLRGMGKVMPVTMAIFSLSSVMLVGIPPFLGFQSKWFLATAALSTGSWIGYLGVGALIISAILTAIYLLVPSMTAYFQPLSDSKPLPTGVREPDYRMLLPLIAWAVMALILTVASGWVVDILSQVAGGVY